MWEGAARWPTQLRRGCWVATGFSRMMGWTKLFWGRSQNLVDVGAGTKKFRCPEPEPEIEYRLRSPAPSCPPHILQQICAHRFASVVYAIRIWKFCNPEPIRNFFINSISETIKLWTPISNPNPTLLNLLHISQYNWYCLFCLTREKLWIFCLLSDKSCWSGHMVSSLRYTKDKG